MTDLDQALNVKLSNTKVPDFGEDLSDGAHQIRPGPGFELSIIVPAFNEKDNVLPLIERLTKTLAGIEWQVIYVDDNSPDGTAEFVKSLSLENLRISCLRRVGRRGLAGAVIEGFLASSAPIVAVIDADLQHDEALLRPMYERLKSGSADLVIATRYQNADGATAGFSASRALGSRMANLVAKWILKHQVSDPVSGFFALRRDIIDRVAPKLSTRGFKILFDLIAAQDKPLVIAELPYQFRQRHAGNSKLDSRVVIDYLGLILSHASHNLLSPRLFLFGMVGAGGVVIHLIVLQSLLSTLTFLSAQFFAAFVAMSCNYFLNNAITYRDRRKKDFLEILIGYLQFCGLCSVGFFANLAVANQIHLWWHHRVLAGAIGAIFGAIWNYTTTALAIW